jgi:hypothetical protein
MPLTPDLKAARRGATRQAALGREFGIQFGANSAQKGKELKKVKNCRAVGKALGRIYVITSGLLQPPPDATPDLRMVTVAHDYETECG